VSIFANPGASFFRGGRRGDESLTAQKGSSVTGKGGRKTAPSFLSELTQRKGRPATRLTLRNEARTSFEQGKASTSRKKKMRGHAASL